MNFFWRRDGSPQTRTNTGAQVPFDDLFRQHFAFVWRCVRALGASTADVDDVVQEVFMITHRKLETYRAGESDRAWLYGILRNVVLNHRRGTRRAHARERALQNEPTPTAPGPDALLDARESAHVVTVALQHLEPAQREVFILVDIEDLPVTEAAAALGVPLNTAYSRLRLARAHFKAAVAKVEGS